MRRRVPWSLGCLRDEKSADRVVWKTVLDDAGHEGHGAHLKAANIVYVDVRELIENELGDKACAFRMERCALHVEVERAAGTGSEFHFRVTQQGSLRDDLNEALSGTGIWRRAFGIGH